MISYTSTKGLEEGKQINGWKWNKKENIYIYIYIYIRGKSNFIRRIDLVMRVPLKKDVVWDT